MRIEFRQEMNRKYMVIIPEAKGTVFNSYLIRMLTENRIKGLLPCTMATIDSSKMLYYETTGWITIEEYLRNNPADESFLTALIRSLAKLMEDLADYLIPGSCILSGMKEIFTDSSGSAFRFTVFPKDEAEFEESMQRLSEILLSKLPHNNQNAAVTGYGFYQICMSGRIAPSDLRSILEVFHEEEDDEESKDSGMDLFEENKRPAARIVQKEKKPYHLWSWIRSKLKRNPQKIYPKPRETDDEEIFRLLYDKKKDTLIEEETGFYGTVYVSPDNLQVSGMTGILSPIDPSDGDMLLLKKETCVAGRAAKDVDLIIDNETVSRIHAKFSRKNGSYAIQDCHSTNGTSVNGRKLPKESSVTLSDGDEVRLGTAAFRFYREFAKS